MKTYVSVQGINTEANVNIRIWLNLKPVDGTKPLVRLNKHPINESTDNAHNAVHRRLEWYLKMTNFNDLTHNLGKAYDAQKSAEKELKGDKKNSGLKQDFFNEATKKTMASLAQKTYDTCNPGSKDRAYFLAERYNPGWRSISAETYSLDGTSVTPIRLGWRVILEEDPAFKPFTYVNKVDKRVWQKQITSSSPMLDDEELKIQDPDLWYRVTEPTRVLKPLEELKPDELAELQGFMYPGPLQVKLAQPRKAKPEELE